MRREEDKDRREKKVETSAGSYLLHRRAKLNFSVLVEGGDGWMHAERSHPQEVPQAHQP